MKQILSALFLALVLNVADLFAQGTHGGGGRLEGCPACMSGEQRRMLEGRMKQSSPSARVESSTDLDLYTFFPMAGRIDGEVFLTNFVDLDAAGGILDSFCSAVSYNGHRGIDTDVVDWTFQDGQIPIFAVLDGEVVATRDGEPDRNTVWNNQPSNLVTLDHGNQHRTTYLHMKNGSVAVSVGDRVLAGQQIGLVGSSGVSSGPHLHFETSVGGTIVEPFTGACRGTQSLWLKQPVLVDKPYIREFNVTTQLLENWEGPPQTVPSTGTLPVGNRVVYFWLNLMNLKENTPYEFRYLDPDGNVLLTNNGLFNTAYRWSWWWWNDEVSFTVTGTHTLEFILDGKRLVQAPIEIIAQGETPANRSPVPANFHMIDEWITPGMVPVCQRSTVDLIDDPDYDLVRYRYVWKVDGQTLRDFTGAATSDAFPRGSSPGSVITCEVTPTDGQASAPTVTSTATVFEASTAWLARNGITDLAQDRDNDGIPNGIEYLLGSNPNEANNLPDPILTSEGSTPSITWTFPRSTTADPRIKLFMEVSENLETWTTAEQQPEPLAAPYVFTYLTLTAQRQFLRLRATFDSGTSITTLTVPIASVIP